MDANEAAEIGRRLTRYSRAIHRAFKEGNFFKAAVLLKKHEELVEELVDALEHVEPKQDITAIIGSSQFALEHYERSDDKPQ